MELGKRVEIKKKYSKLDNVRFSFFHTYFFRLLYRALETFKWRSLQERKLYVIIECLGFLTCCRRRRLLTENKNKNEEKKTRTEEVWGHIFLEKTEDVAEEEEVQEAVQECNKTINSTEILSMV